MAHKMISKYTNMILYFVHKLDNLSSLRDRKGCIQRKRMSKACFAV